jgi:pimeloyl-ACP methyl ester carboxylesterase
MASYVLVHGSWHGGWCWHRVVAGLERSGHRVLAPDLLSLGRDFTPYASVTLSAWADQIAALVRAEDEPVVLVGHSRGGIVISEVAERIPQRVRGLVYVTAFLLENGQTLQDIAGQDDESLVLPSLVLAEDLLSASFRETAARDAFYGQCSEEDVVLALSLLRPEPMAPIATPVRTTTERFGRVPRVYIECDADRAISLAMQRRMQSALPCRTRITLRSDHSPFLSCAPELTVALLSMHETAIAPTR